MMKAWQHVIFSDESKYCLFGSDGKIYCQRKIGRAYNDRVVKKTVKHGDRSIMVWGCISRKGPERLYRVDERMDGPKYCQILKDAFLEILQDLGLHQSNILFQQDNDPKHTSRVAKA
jgi:hypothetical protein